VIPSENHIKSWVEELSRSNPNLAKTIASLRYVVISKNGLEVSSGVRQRNIIGLFKGKESSPLK
jgi:hypothetical protein